MLRRTTVLGITLLVLTLVAAPAVAAESAARGSATAKTSKSTSSARTWLQQESVPTFTNADIHALPAADNWNLPALDDLVVLRSPDRFEIIGTPAAEGETVAPGPTVDPQAATESTEWVARMVTERGQSARIKAAQRRVRRAESRIPKIKRTYRPPGSAFSTRGGGTDQLFMRGVASATFKYDDAIREAYLELAEARAGLDLLLQ